MHRVRLVHWNDDEAVARAAALRAAGYAVDYEPLTPAALRQIKADPPAAVLIDLSRLPAQGRDIGIALRHSRTTRAVPLVFVEGEERKVDKIKRQLPDAEYTTWRRYRSALRRAIANPPRNPTKPSSVLAGYAGTPLPRKLGIKPGCSVTLVDAPSDMEEKLGELPSGAKLRRQLRGRVDLIIWFVRSTGDLERRVGRMAAKVGDGGMWIAWPKKASGVATDVTQSSVRMLGLASGLVDYKICAIDDTWSGLKFAPRKSDAPLQ